MSAGKAVVARAKEGFFSRETAIIIIVCVETTTGRCFPSQTANYVESVARFRHHHELCNGVVNFENISVW